MSSFKCPKIDGFVRPSLNIDGFHGTHQIYDKGAPAEKIDRYSVSADTIFLKNERKLHTVLLHHMISCSVDDK